MVEGLDAEEYEALVTGAETYRAALVVRLGGEAGLRTGEITCVTRDTSVRRKATRISPSSVPSDDTEGETKAGDDPETEGAPRDHSGIDRETAIPASLAAELRRYAESADLRESEPFVDVSPRRVQMIVSETAEHAAARTDGLVDPDVTPRDLRRTFARRLLVDRGVDPTRGSRGRRLGDDGDARRLPRGARRGRNRRGDRRRSGRVLGRTGGRICAHHPWRVRARRRRTTGRRPRDGSRRRS